MWLFYRFAFVRFGDVQKAIAAYEEINKKALAGQPPMLFGSKVFVSLAREKNPAKQKNAQTAQQQAGKKAPQTTPASQSPAKGTQIST